MGRACQEEKEMNAEIVDTSSLVPAPFIDGEDDEETSQLAEMFQEAKSYIESFEWAPPIKNVWLGLGVGGVVAVFLFQFEEPIQGRDDMLWVICGDLPCAYLVPDNARNAVAALRAYCELMDDWIHSVESGEPNSDVFPVDAPSDQHHANLLKKRIDFIRSRIIPHFES